MIFKFNAIFLSITLSISASAELSVEPLPTLNIQSNKISVSGVSSGGYMAQQLHVAYSEIFSAVGIVAGGPYYCAENSVGIALTRCMKPNEVNKPNADSLAELTKGFDAMGNISSTLNMQKDRVWIFSSPDDSVVLQPVSDALSKYYQHFVSSSNIKYISNIGGEHSMPTDDFGYPCDYLGKSDNSNDYFINNCGFDAAGELLSFSNKTIKKPTAESLSGRFIKFSQAHYITNPTSHGMSEFGYAYVPKKCDTNAKGQSKKCKLHIALHGCLQSADRIGTIFIKSSGYNDWADRNNIVMLYPQATQSLDQGNGNGCWDWWGYDSNDYAVKTGNQMLAINNMIQRVSNDSSPNQLAAPILAVESDYLGNITLHWTEVEHAIGYEVYESNKSDGPYFPVSISIIESNLESIILEPGAQKHYVVLAVSADGEEGDISNEVAVAIPRLF